MLWASAGWAAGFGWIFLTALALTAIHCLWQVRAVRLDEPDNCLSIFKSNRVVGWLMLAGLVLDRLVA